MSEANEAKLVEEVAARIGCVMGRRNKTTDHAARAAILKVADWVRQEAHLAEVALDYADGRDFVRIDGALVALTRLAQELRAMCVEEDAASKGGPNV